MDQQKIARFLKQLRQESGLTQEQLAEQLGVNPRTVSRWETARTMPDFALLVELGRRYGVTVDELVTYKGKRAIIPFSDRIEIVRSIKYVDAAVPQYDMDKLTMCKKLGASILFVGDDWYGTDKWREYEKEFAEAGVRIVYFPYTRGVSSTQVSKALAAVRGQEGKKEEGQ